MAFVFDLPKVFHVSHVVDDLDAAVAWYEDVFSSRLWQRSELFGTSLALLVVGDVVLMPMQPASAFPTAPGRFRQRFGQRLHSLALYVDNPDDLISHLRSQGLRLTGSDGTELRNPQDEIWTQPRETPILFEFFQPRTSMNDPRLEEQDWSSTFWRDDHPLGITGACFTVVTADPDAATRFFVEGLHGEVVHNGTVAAYGTSSAFVALSDEVMIEVAEPLEADTAAGRDLAQRATFHAVTFQVADLERAAGHIESKGVRTDRPAPGHLLLEPEDCFGVRFRITDRDISAW
jgi:catechol 2,3-dioxygenase-like lactoylglutathione lyase family enzyme